jgi:hypothetical protein
MEVLGRLHFGDSRHLFWVRVNTTTGDHIPSSFPEGTTDVHFSGFNFILNFLRLSKVFA